jgi:hypothetical protein
MSNEDIVVVGIWIVAALVAMVVIGGALYAGWHDRSAASLVRWRGVKLWSALLGVVGLALLIISFDQLIKDSIRAKSREYAADRFLEAKFILVRDRAISCSQSASGTNDACGAIRNVDHGFMLQSVRNGIPLSEVTADQRRNPAVDRIGDKLNRLVYEINGASRIGASQPFISSQEKVPLLLVAVFLVVLSIAGNVGEAAYQYQQAVLSMASKPTTS